jgi:hypothetical protein
MPEPQPSLDLGLPPADYAAAHAVTLAAPALADAYREWFLLVADLWETVEHPAADYQEVLALIQAAEGGVPNRDAVYHAAKVCWVWETGRDPLTGRLV